MSRISLYIADQLADLDSESLVLFNYTQEDLSNPTIVKNSYSQQITLKGTPTNNAIFGDAFKLNRSIGNTGGSTGADFRPMRKTPFQIFNELGEILQSGYVKLDSVSKTGADVSYKVTLYGGLGSFFYELSYDDNGDKKTLASLDYLGTSSPETELDFAINATSVQAAWTALKAGTAGKWAVINFAPALNGIPDGNFDAAKALVNPSDIGLASSITDDGTTYTTKNGYCLVNLANECDEWAVKDLRSYFQRPVLSMKAFINAICRASNNGGYTVDASKILTDGYFPYRDTWLTLPMISSLSPSKKESGDLTATLISPSVEEGELGYYNIEGTVASGATITANVHFKVRMTMTLSSQSGPYYWYFDETSSKRQFSVMVLQAVAYDSSDNIVGGSTIKVIGYGTSARDILLACGYTAEYDAGVDALITPEMTTPTTLVGELSTEISMTAEGVNVDHVDILASAYQGVRNGTRYTYSGNGDLDDFLLWNHASGSTVDSGFTPGTFSIVSGTTSDTVTYTSGSSLRSNAQITKKLLLSSSSTPADYLLSFCKTFGLLMTYDDATKKITILRRNDLYEDTTIDLTGRVCLDKGIDIVPMVFDAKWYDLKLEGVGGAFGAEYKEIEGIEYGIQRVNTGYDFNADSSDIMADVLFKNACAILNRSKYLNYILSSNVFKPSPFIDKGNTYTLWSSAGDTLDTDISCPPTSATVTYYNTDHNGYDKAGATKVEMRDSSDSPLDGADVLLFHEGETSYPYFKLTDDVDAMDTLNDGKPCWLLAPGAASGVEIPIFSRYGFNAGVTQITESLDFGVPKQIDIPDVTYGSGITVYEQGWKAYLADRYDENTKVMTCRVDFSGIQVNQNLLRKFYYYDDCIWVLNQIKNYSLTTSDPVECEFIQVQDKDNYLSGQDYGD